MICIYIYYTYYRLPRIFFRKSKRSTGILGFDPTSCQRQGHQIRAAWMHQWCQQHAEGVSVLVFFGHGQILAKWYNHDFIWAVVCGMISDVPPKKFQVPGDRASLLRSNSRTWPETFSLAFLMQQSPPHGMVWHAWQSGGAGWPVWLQCRWHPDALKKKSHRFPFLLCDRMG